MTSLHTIVVGAQHARTWIAAALLAIALFGAPLATNAVGAAQAPHAATPHYSVSGTSSPVASVTPFGGCGAIIAPC